LVTQNNAPGHFIFTHTHTHTHTHRILKFSVDRHRKTAVYTLANATLKN